MVRGKIMIRSELGLHLRPASILCNLAILYPCLIELKTDNRTVNAKSVLGVLSACIRKEDVVELTCEGEKEQEAFDEISRLLRSDFAEHNMV